MTLTGPSTYFIFDSYILTFEKPPGQTLWWPLGRGTLLTLRLWVGAPLLAPSPAGSTPSSELLSG